MDDEVACTPLIELAMKKLSGTHFLEPISENLGMSSVLHFGVSTAPSESITFESENWSRIRKSEWCIPNFSSMSSNFNSLSITENNIGELTSTKENPANNLLMNSILLSQRSDKRSHRSLQEISCLRASDIYCDIDDTSSVRNGFQRAEISLSSSDRQQLKEGGNFYRNVTRDVLDLTDSYHKTREETSLLLNDRNFLSVDDSEELPAFPTVSSHDGDKGSVFAISSLSDDDEYQKLLTGNYTECDGLECELDFDRGGSSCLAIPETHIAGRQIISQLSAAEEDLTYDIGHKDLQSTYRLCPHASLTVTDGSARCDETLLKNSHLEGENTLKISAHSLSPTADDTMFMQNFHPSTNSPHQNDGGELSFGNQNSSHSITSHEVDCDFTLTESNLEGSSDFLTVECDITNDRHESKQKDDFVYMTDTDLTPFCNYNFKEGLNLTATDLSHESRFSNDVESQKNNEEPLHDENLQFMNVSLCSDDFQKQICRDGMTTEPSQSTNVHDDLICGPSFLQNEKGRIHGDALVVDQQFDSENSNVATAATLTVDVSSCRFSNSDLQDPLPNTCASSSGDQLSGTSLPDSQQQDATPVNFQNDTSYCQTKDDRLSLDDFNMEVDQQSDSENSTVRTATPLAGRSADIKSGHSVEMTLLLDNDSNDDALSLMAPSIDNDSLLGLSAVDNPPMPAVQ